MVELKETRNINTLIDWRVEVIRNVFGEAADSTLIEANRQYYLRNISDGSHISFIASIKGIDCGCGRICFSEELPSPDNPTGKYGYLMNIYVREAYRNNGIAHTKVSRLVEEASKRTCGKIYLETTAEGKPVYSSLGFHEMNDMMKYYGTDN